MLLLLLLSIIVLVLIFRKSTTYGFSFIGIILLIGYLMMSNTTNKDYYDSGELKSEMIIRGGELAKGIFYHKNGKISLQGDYRDGMKQGLWSQYYEEGQLEAELMFLNDLFRGRNERFHKNGKTKELGYWDGYYDYSSRTYKHEWWHENGMKKSERYYNGYIADSVMCWNENGIEIECDEVIFLYNKEEGLTNKIPLDISLSITKEKMKRLNESPIFKMKKMKKIE